MKLRDRENLSTLGIFLGAVALAAALALALVSQFTAEPIRKAAEQNRLKTFYRLRLPEFDKVGSEVVVDGVTFYPVFSGEKKVGFIGQGEASGYGGKVELLVGFDADGNITAVQVLKHKETPGLGANVCERKFQRTVYNLFAAAPEIPDNRWLDQFDSRNVEVSGNLHISKDGGDIAFLTGATVTSRAVTQGVSNICKAFCAGKFTGKKGE